MSGLLDWIHDYIRALPPGIRPRDDDPRFVRAAQTARANGWTPAWVIRQVTASNYDGKRNPALIALMNLERIAETSPATTPIPDRAPARGDPNDPIACSHPEHVRQRVQLIHRLLATPLADMDEDAREQAMRDLIAAQKTEH